MIMSFQGQIVDQPLFYKLSALSRNIEGMAG